MKSKISIQINHQTHLIDPGLSVAAALAQCGQLVTRTSVSGETRAPFCGMGVCQECRVTINQQAHISLPVKRCVAKACLSSLEMLDDE